MNGPKIKRPPSLVDLIPGYGAAVEHETSIRDEAFLDAPEFLCGVEVRPFTLDSFALLNAVGSPFILGTEPEGEDVARFFWSVSPDYQRALWWRSRLEPFSYRLAATVFDRIRLQFLKRLRQLDAQEAINAVEAYVDDALMDAPKSSKGVTPDGTAYWSMLAGLIGMLALETGWSERDIRRLPTKRAFQYLRLLVKRNNPDKILSNPSDDVRGEWLRMVNTKPA